MVLPRPMLHSFFPPDGKDATGSRVSATDSLFLVVGIYDSKWKRDVFIPFSTARMMASDKEDLRQLSVDLKDVHTEEDGNSAKRGTKDPC